MIFGKINITRRAVETHKDSYRLEQLTVVSVRRPFLPLGVMAAIGGSAFAFRFSDLLYVHELQVLIGGSAVLSILCVKLGQLQLLSRDLRGSELTGAIWGGYGHLNRIRRQSMAAVEAQTSRVFS